MTLWQTGWVEVKEWKNTRERGEETLQPSGLRRDGEPRRNSLKGWVKAQVWRNLRWCHLLAKMCQAWCQMFYLSQHPLFVVVCQFDRKLTVDHRGLRSLAKLIQLRVTKSHLPLKSGWLSSGWAFFPLSRALRNYLFTLNCAISLGWQQASTQGEYTDDTLLLKFKSSQYWHMLFSYPTPSPLHFYLQRVLQCFEH